MVHDVNRPTKVVRENSRERTRHDVRTASRPERLDQPHRESVT
jgi:hypothetical protein